MNEIQLAALIELYALITWKHKDELESSLPFYVKSFLISEFDNNVANEFNDYFKEYYDSLENNEIDFDKQLNHIASKLQKHLSFNNRLKVIIDIINLLKYYQQNLNYEENDSLFHTIYTISRHLKLNEKEFNDIFWILHGKPYKIDRQKIIICNNGNSNIFKGYKQIIKDNIKVNVFFYKINNCDSFLFYYQGNQDIKLNGELIFNDKAYLFSLGDFICIEESSNIQYNELVRISLSDKEEDELNFTVNEVFATFQDGITAIEKFSFEAKSGYFVGILGGSGTGKTTLINIMNGNLEPDSGEILINGHNFHLNKRKTEGLIGYVPQDDLLINELTVFDNLYFNASLCLGNLTRKEKTKKVVEVLECLNIYDIKDKVVGSPLNKIISGGERKRVNIALELLREPKVLFIDEPTSGLSSSDSLLISKVLANLANKGMLVVVNIHQPSSEIFSLFDKILILEKGGKVIYDGLPFKAVNYFEENSGILPSAPKQNAKKLNPENIFLIVEETKTNEEGLKTKQRKFTSDNWYRIYRRNFPKKPQKSISKLPGNHYKPANLYEQLIIFFKRTFKSKTADTQFITIALLISPLLSFFLSLFCKYKNSLTNFDYIFGKNPNIPSFLFMAVITILFVGMVMSAESLFTDKKIRNREKFLNLSSLSYLNSKVIFFFLISLFQSITFVLISSLVLDFEGMFLTHFLILFSIACYANLMGLLISGIMNSLAAIYFLIPILIIPQLLLGGIVVKYDKIHWLVSSQKYTPVIADLMVSKWGYEALMVNQFKNNKFNKNFYYMDSKESNLSFVGHYFIPEIINDINDYINDKTDYDKINQSILKIEEYVNFNLIKIKDKPSALKAKKILEDLKLYCYSEIEKIINKKDNMVDSLTKTLGGRKNYIKFMHKYHNESVEDIVLNRDDMTKIIYSENEYIRKSEPIYHKSLNSLPRAHFYAPSKNIGSLQINTLAFNVLIIWLNTLIIYLILYTILRSERWQKLFKILTTKLTIFK